MRGEGRGERRGRGEGEIGSGHLAAAHKQRVGGDDGNGEALAAVGTWPQTADGPR